MLCFYHNCGVLVHQIKVVVIFTFSLGWKRKLYSCNFGTIILCFGHLLFVLLCLPLTRTDYPFPLCCLAFTRIQLLLSDAGYFFPGLHGPAELWASFCVSGDKSGRYRCTLVNHSGAVAAMDWTPLTKPWCLHMKQHGRIRGLWTFVSNFWKCCDFF
jgi:hypothetical protein